MAAAARPAAGTRPTVAALLAGWCEAGLGVTALIFYPLLVVAPRGVAPLAVAAGLMACGIVAGRAGRPLAHPELASPALLLAALLVWGVVSAAWSPDALRSLDQAARLLGIFVPALALAAAAPLIAAPRRLLWLLVTGFMAAMVMATADLAAGGAISKPFSDRVYQPAWLNQAAVGFAILLLPTSAALIAVGYRWPGLLFAAAAAATIFALAGTAAKTALAAGLPIAILCFYRRVPAARVMAALSVLVIVTAPLTFARLDRLSGSVQTADEVKLSAGHRLLIWSFVGDRIAEHPLRGWGLDSSRAIPGGNDPIRPNQTWLPLHPHNAALQAWLELGVPGGVLLALLCGWLWLAYGGANWPRLYAAAAGGSLATALVASAATYGIWQEWWLGALSFSLFMVLVMGRSGAGAAEGE